MANERETAEAFITELMAAAEPLDHVVFFAVFDNVCKDGSVDIVRKMGKVDPRIKVVWAPQNSCPVDAYICAYKEALNTGYEWVLEINAGYRHQPADLAQFFPLMRENYDYIFGSRFCDGGNMETNSFFRRVLAQGGTWAANFLLGTRLSDMTSGYQMFRRDTLKKILDHGIHSRFNFFQTEMKTQCRNLNGVEVPLQYRTGSKSISTKAIREALWGLVRLTASRVAGSL